MLGVRILQIVRGASGGMLEARGHVRREAHLPCHHEAENEPPGEKQCHRRVWQASEE
jgi:hypothetical protein